MNQILAKIKSLNKYVKLISDQLLFQNIDIKAISCMNYSPETILEDGEWYKIESFSKKDFFLDLLKNEINSKNFNLLDRNDFEKISLLISLQENNVYFQKITPSLFIKKKSFIFSFGENAILETANDRLFINEHPDAVYFNNEDVLIFKKLSTISSIFKGIDQLYREATNSEVALFLTHSLIKTSNYTVENVSIPNRKRISLAIDTLNCLNSIELQEITSYINEYCNNTLNYDQTLSAFNISNDEELKLLLFGIEQRFYTTQIGHEKRIANSIAKIS